MKYFTAGESAPKEYNGGRRFDVLKKFAEVRPARFTRHAVILLSPPSFQRSDPRLAWHRAPCRAKPATQPPLPPPRRCQSSLDAPPAPRAFRQSEARLPAPLQGARIIRSRKQSPRSHHLPLLHDLVQTGAPAAADLDTSPPAPRSHARSGLRRAERPRAPQEPPPPPTQPPARHQVDAAARRRPRQRGSLPVGARDKGAACLSGRGARPVEPASTTHPGR